jgi:hypothetical protein
MLAAKSPQCPAQIPQADPSFREGVERKVVDSAEPHTYSENVISRAQSSLKFGAHMSPAMCDEPSTLLRLSESLRPLLFFSIR